MKDSNTEIVVGSDVTTIRNSARLTGIQRVIVETHKHLQDLFENTDFKLRPFDESKRPSNEFLQNNRLREDTVLSGENIPLKDTNIYLNLGHIGPIDIKSFLQLKREGRLKSIFMIHDIIPITNPEWFPAADGKTTMRRYLQTALAVADVIVVPSEHVKREISNLGWKTSARIEVIHLGVYDQNLPIEEFKGDEPSLVCVGTVEPRKGHNDLIDAFDELLESGVKTKLHIVGIYGWGAEAVAQRITEHQEFNRRLFWHRNLNDQDVLQIYKESKFAIMASFAEGFGLPLEEAIAHKRIVVARNIDVFRERENENIIYFDEKNKLSEVLKKNWQRDWKTPQFKNVRGMKDFSRDIFQLIQELV